MKEAAHGKAWLKRLGKWLGRAVITAAAIYLVFRKVSWKETWDILRGISPAWVLAALALYNLSQVCSAARLLGFYHRAGAPLPARRNLLLYYQGMGYNLFLPGGIGGDGYKVHYLYKRYRTPVRQLIIASVLDRLHGLEALALLMAMLAGTGILPAGMLGWSPAWLTPACVLGCAGALWAIRRFFPRYFPVTGQAWLWSLGVQLLQLASVLCLLAALGPVHSAAAYLLLFLASSVAAAIPFTIGGAGAREIVFMAGASMLGIAREEAVAVSLLFFLLTAVSSLPALMVPLGSAPVARSR